MTATQKPGVFTYICTQKHKYLNSKTQKPNEQSTGKMFDQTFYESDPHPMNRQKHLYMTALQKQWAFTYISLNLQMSELNMYECIYTID